jgi:hypothetical protein
MLQQQLPDSRVAVAPGISRVWLNLVPVFVFLGLVGLLSCGLAGDLAGVALDLRTALGVLGPHGHEIAEFLERLRVCLLEVDVIAACLVALLVALIAETDLNDVLEFAGRQEGDAFGELLLLGGGDAAEVVEVGVLAALWFCGRLHLGLVELELVKLAQEF